ncbi:MAG: hypothetical protein PVH31_09330 [Ectothiorhodospiraceae bacterium]|jgi:hypothetical protein
MRTRYLYGLALAAVLTAAAGEVAAADLSYNHLGLGVGNIELDDSDADGTGFSVDGSFAIHPNAYLIGRYANWDLDGPDREDFRVGGGLHTPLQSNVDLIGELFYENRDYDINGRGDDDNDGLGLRGGVRAKAAPRLELDGGAVYYALDEDDAAGVWGEAWYDVTQPIQAGLQAELTDEESIISLGGRYRF